MTMKIYDISVGHDGRILAALDRNKVAFGLIAESDETLQVSNLKEFTIEDDDIGRLEQVALLEHSSDLFLTRGRKQAKLCNAVTEQMISPIGNQGTGYLEVCRHDSHLVAMSSIGEGFSIYDIRQPTTMIYTGKGPFYSQSKIKWNPFIPYWVGANSEDELSIFDLRYLRDTPMRLYDARYINDFAWSNSNCELVLGVTASRNASLWSLSSTDEMTVSVPHADCGGDVVQIFSSSRDLNLFYGLSQLGKLVRIDIQRDFLEGLAPRNNSDGIARDIETSLYCRDFAAVYRYLLNYSNIAAHSSFKELQFMANQTVPTPSIPSTAWNFKTLGDQDSSFQQDLETFSKKCPPGFDVSGLECNTESIKDSVESIRFKVRILEMIQKNDQKGLLASKDRILKAAIETPGYLNSEAVRRIITILLDEYRLDALKFGRHILAQSSPRLDSDGYSLLHLLLYPTIFDFDAAKLVATKVSERASPLKPTTLNMSKDPLMPPVPTMQANTTKTVRGVLPYTTASGKELMDLHRHVRSLKQALSMVDLEISCEEESPDKVADFLLRELSVERNTASARLVWSYLESLLDRQQLDKYFAQIGQFVKQPLTDFGSALLEHLDHVVIPKLKYILAQAIDTQRPSLVVRAILLIAILVNGIRPLPDGLEPFLLDRLRRLVRAMSCEDYTSMTGYGQLVEYMQSIVIPSGCTGIWADLFRLQTRLVHN